MQTFVYVLYVSCSRRLTPNLTLVDGLVVPPRVENVEGPLLVLLHIHIHILVNAVVVMMTVTVTVMLTALMAVVAVVVTAMLLLLPPPPPPPPMTSPRLSLRHLHGNSESETQLN